MLSLSPVPAFPGYTGPHPVGTLDVEIPVSDLPQSSARPEDAPHILTVQFRIYYPAVRSPAGGDAAKGPKVTWLPLPQREHILGYTQFVGASPRVASMLSYLPRHLHYTTIPASKNAPLLSPPSADTEGWPTIIFSHGLGGSRNAYSHIAGSLASHGAVVFCPEHRDGSAVTSFVRDPSKRGSPRSSTPIPFRRISHVVSPEMYEAREAQLRVRLWEMALVYEAVERIARGETVDNLNTSTEGLGALGGVLDTRPGRVVFAGHSFGSATTIQLLKSTFYADDASLAAMERPLFKPAAGAAIRRQVTAESASILLDLWATPIIGPNSAELLSLPMPAYARGGPGGKAILSVLSEAFYKWDSHMRMTARILSPTPSEEAVAESSYRTGGGPAVEEPRLFYVRGAAHLSQSDFGILFPWLIRRMFKVREPERVTRLNLRAMLQFLRSNGVAVGRTSTVDLVDGPADAGGRVAGTEGGVDDDPAILEKKGVETWVWIDTVALFEGAVKSDRAAAEGVERGEAGMEGELEPVLEGSSVDGVTSEKEVGDTEMPPLSKISV